jgi:tetratricopeptide (TPR) repeat protein
MIDKNTVSSAAPLLALCMIVKDEATNLSRCLASVKPHVDEMIVVDTGSKDDTVEIAHQFGAKVEYFQWCDDFAAARNYAIAQVTSQWILMIDADEELVVEDSSFLQELQSQQSFLAYTLLKIDAYKATNVVNDRAIKIFRNIPEIKYTGRLHEQIKYQDQYLHLNRTGYLTKVSILDYSYSDEKIPHKLARNINILEKIRQEEGLDLRLLLTLIQLYQTQGNLQKKQECCAEALEQISPNLVDERKPEDMFGVPTLLYALGYNLLENQDYETLSLLCQRGLQWSPRYPPLCYLTGLLVSNLGFPRGAIAYFKQCLDMGETGNYDKIEPFNKDFVTTHPTYSLGCMYIRLYQYQEAASAFENALKFSPDHAEAKQNLEEVKRILNGSV